MHIIVTQWIGRSRDSETGVRQGLVKRNTNRCSELDYDTNPNSNYSQSMTNSLFDFSSAHVSTKNATSLTPFIVVNSGEIGNCEVKQGQLQQKWLFYYSILQLLSKYQGKFFCLLFHSCVYKKCKIFDTLYSRGTVNSGEIGNCEAKQGQLQRDRV